MIGCATIPQGTAPSSSPLIDKSGKDINYEVLGTSEADAGHFSLFGFIPFGRADIDEAINEAIQKKGGDNLINLCYDIEYASYFIFGSSTSINVKGDVIKYSGTNESSVTNKTELVDYESPSKLPTSHAISANILSNGLGFYYNLIIPFNKILFGKLGIGYRSFEEEVEETYYTYWYGYYPSKYKTKYQFIPITFSMGVNSEGFIETDIPVNGIASFGFGYYPDVDRDEWVNFGWNLGLGAEYRVIKNLALGLFFNYHKLFVGEDNLSNFYGNYSERGKQSFSEFGLMVRFVP
jgi:opacity protein-like surface antigen